MRKDQRDPRGTGDEVKIEMIQSTSLDRDQYLSRPSSRNGNIVDTQSSAVTVFM